MDSLVNNEFKKIKNATWTGEVWIKNIVHSIASCCFVIWLTGFLAYDVSIQFHYFLVISVFMALLRFLMERKSAFKKSKMNLR